LVLGARRGAPAAERVGSQHGSVTVSLLPLRLHCQAYSGSAQSSGRNAIGATPRRMALLFSSRGLPSR
jgi:hypothetical protein